MLLFIREKRLDCLSGNNQVLRAFRLENLAEVHRVFFEQ